MKKLFLILVVMLCLPIFLFTKNYTKLKGEDVKFKDVPIVVIIKDKNDIEKFNNYSTKKLDNIGTYNLVIPYSVFKTVRDSIPELNMQINNPRFSVNKINETMGSWTLVTSVEGNNEEWHDGDWTEGTSSTSSIPYSSWGGLGLDSYNTTGSAYWITQSINPSAEQLKIVFRCLGTEWGVGQYVDLFLRDFSDWSWVAAGTITDKNNQEWYIDAINISKNVLNGRCDLIATSNDGYVFDYIKFYQVCNIPTTPTNVSASDGDYCDKIRITWSSVTGATKYKIVRGSTTLEENWTGLSYDDGNAGTSSYEYKVYAGNGCGWSGYDSDNGYRSIAPNSPTNVSASDGDYCDKIRITWSSVTGATKYKIVRGSTTLEENWTGLSYDDGNAGTSSYEYKVYAGNGCGWSGYDSDNGYRNTSPAKPANFQASDGNYESYVSLTWANVSGANGFTIKRDDEIIMSSNSWATTYQDNSAIQGMVHSYSIQANDNCGQSSDWATDTGWRPTYIRGKISSKNGTGIHGITVTTDGKSNQTDNNGNYMIKDLNYGTSSQTFQVIPSLLRHYFSPEKQSVLLNKNQQYMENVNFTDTSSFSVKGQIIFTNTSCGVKGVHILIDGKETDPNTITDDNGEYNLALFYGEHTIKVMLEGHKFDNESQTIKVENDITNVNFIDNTSYLVTFKAQTGCNELVPNIKFKIESGECFDVSLTSGSNGTISTTLPPINYIASAYSSEHPDWFADNNITFTLLKDTSITFLHNLPLHVEVEGMPTSSDCNNGLYAIQSEDSANLRLSVRNSTGCIIENATVIVTDNVGDVAEDIILSAPNGMINYTLKGGEPANNNPPNYTKTIIFQVKKENYNTTNEIIQIPVVVTGNKLVSESFTTSIPNIPIRILHDPPGDMSYSHHEEKFKFNQKYIFSFENSIGTNVKVGTSAGFGNWNLGVSGALGAKAVSMGSGEVEFEFTLSNGITSPQSSDYSNVMGPGHGDLYMGIGLNIFYGIGERVKINGCKVEVDSLILWGPSNISTTYFYTANHIKSQIMEMDCDLLEDPDNVSACKKSWENILNMNIGYDNVISEKEKESLEFIANKSIVGGASVSTYIEEATIKKSLFYSTQVEINTEVAAFFSIPFLEGGASVEMGVTVGNSTSSSQSYTTTTGYYLGDDDPGDIFNVDIYRDLIFGTPLFISNSSSSSCPWELYTTPAQNVSVNAIGHQIQNVQNSAQAVFEIRVNNENTTQNSSKEYRIWVPQELNKSYACIQINGGSPDINATIADYANFNVTVSYCGGTISDTSKFAIVGSSRCDASVADTIWFQVNWTAPCEMPTISLIDPLTGISLPDEISFKEIDSLVIYGYLPTGAETDKIVFKYKLDDNENFIEYQSVVEPTYSNANYDYYRSIWNIPAFDSIRGFNIIATNRLNDGFANSKNIYSVKIIYQPVGIANDEIKNIPVDYYLSENYPNPFNPSTKIKYSIPQTSFVTLKIYDILGREIETLVNEEKNVGYYEVNFDANRLASGIYIYKMQAGNFISSKKFILLR